MAAVEEDLGSQLEQEIDINLPNVEPSTGPINHDSDSENEKNIHYVKKLGFRRKIFNSDSESEAGDMAQIENDNETNLLNVKKLGTRRNILNSDSEQECEDAHDLLDVDVGNLDGVKSKKFNRVAVADGETEDSGDQVTPHIKSFPDEGTAMEAAIYAFNSKGELTVEAGINNRAQRSSLAALCDPDTSDEEMATSKDEENHMENSKSPCKISKLAPKRTKVQRPKVMTAQEAAKQRVEIQSESQRRVRESTISLPYHRPKTHTLKEFLQKRSKLASALPKNSASVPSVAIKMSKDQLIEVSKNLDLRTREVEEFYKSESEEEEEDGDEVPRAIRSWLDALADTAADIVENKIINIDSETHDRNSHQAEPCNGEQLMDYEFNLDDINETECSSRPKIAELIEENLLHIQPMLSGQADEVIDLDDGLIRPNAVKILVEKFLKHTVKKSAHKHKVEMNVVGVGTTGEIVKETVSMNVYEDEEPVMVETPGAKLQKLRCDLQDQMAKKRLELWKQKQEYIICISADKGEDVSHVEKDILDNEEEEEITDSEYTDEDEEEFEDVDLPPKKPRKHCEFLDEEAEEDSLNDDSDVGAPDDALESVCNDFEDELSDSGGLEEDEGVQEEPKKVLKRILRPFMEESEEEDDEPAKEIAVVNPRKDRQETVFSSDDDTIPPNLPRIDQTQHHADAGYQKSELDFCTPISYLTGLQNITLDSKLLEDLPVSVPYTPLSEQFDTQAVQETDLPSKEPDATQDNIEHLAELCSGKFTETQKVLLEENGEEDVPSTQDLLNVCSGNFFSLAGTMPTGMRNNEPQGSSSTDAKDLDDNDQIITQLLNEDELERFKRKFESPINPIVNRSQFWEDREEVNATGLINSDEENEGELEIKKRKKQKKLVFSDDEESSEDGITALDPDDEEELDLHDESAEDNEGPKSTKYKLADYLDQEAELTESEWDSADEDEKGLDELEFEQGDQENFNETKVRNELERIHMRQVLNDDNREIKLLQELLLEDGELHGTGRQRQFRWKTLDSVDNGEFDKRDDDDVFMDEEESEEHYRKMRHKREMFLKKKSQVENLDTVLEDNRIFKVGQTILKNSSFSSQTTATTTKVEAGGEPFSLLNKRGSFLTRNDQVLERLMEYTKLSTIANGVTKNSRGFLFQTVENIEGSTVIKNNHKRKASDGTPQAIKKLRLTDLSPAVDNKKSANTSKAKKLFKNW